MRADMARIFYLINGACAGQCVYVSACTCVYECVIVYVALTLVRNNYSWAVKLNLIHPMTRVTAAAAAATPAATLEIDCLILFCSSTHTHQAWASGRSVWLLSLAASVSCLAEAG